VKINTMQNIKMNDLNDMTWYHAFLKKRTWLLLLFPISLFILLIVRKNTYVAEYVFARIIYRSISQGVSLITGIVPFSIMELMVLSVPILGIGVIVLMIYGLYSSGKNKDGKIKYLLILYGINIGCVISIALFMFIMLGGVNYYRYPFSYSSGLEVRESSVDELYEVTAYLAKEASSVRTQLHKLGIEDENGVIYYTRSELSELGKELRYEYLKASKEYSVFSGHYGKFKPVVFSKFMSRMEITGIYWPFTGEANVNVHAPKYSVPVTIAHEMAHQRGFMREDEANFIAYLICIGSDNLQLQYSGVMHALSYASSELYKYDSDLYYEVAENYNEAMLADLRDEYYYWKQFEDTVISTISTNMNDSYLKANNQSDGVKSYGRMVDLLLAHYRYEQGK
jgi:hypothetical protein